MGSLVFLIGISGSGKSTYCKDYPDALVISPDNIRRSLTGSVSDQSKNALVFDLAYKRLSDALQQGLEHIIFDSTGLHTPGRLQVLDMAHQYGYVAEAVLFLDSCDLGACRDRVRGDIQGKVDRSDVPDDVLERQHRAFSVEREKIKHEGWDKVSIRQGGTHDT